MKFATPDDLKAQGFEGFFPIAKLRASKCAEVPKVPGVYCVARDSNPPPSFLPTSPGGHFKGRDPTVPTSTLESGWVPGTVVVYIGKSGSEGSAATLRERLWRYLRFGAGEPVAHWGGRLTWQLAEHESLLLCWRASAGRDPGEEKRELLSDFETLYGALPFANLNH